MRRLAQGHLHTQQGGAGDGTSNPPVTSQPALPEPHAGLSLVVCLSGHFNAHNPGELTPDRPVLRCGCVL